MASRLRGTNHAPGSADSAVVFRCHTLPGAVVVIVVAVVRFGTVGVRQARVRRGVAVIAVDGMVATAVDTRRRGTVTLAVFTAVRVDLAIADREAARRGGRRAFTDLSRITVIIGGAGIINTVVHPPPRASNRHALSVDSLCTVGVPTAGALLRYEIIRGLRRRKDADARRGDRSMKGRNAQVVAFVSPRFPTTGKPQDREQESRTYRNHPNALHPGKNTPISEPSKPFIVVPRVSSCERVDEVITREQLFSSNEQEPSECPTART